MKQKCIRCVVQLSLAELLWQDGNEVDIHLEGPALFVRACVLGQLQHSRLHKPVFPVQLNQELTFDRILTNCKHPSLFNEVIRGEHIKIEIIQVSPDYQGGKILARFESPAHKFLFPNDAPPTGDVQHVLLNKSRKCEHPPLLTFTCSTTLMETTVQSPVDVIFNESKLDTSHDGDDGDSTSTQTPPSQLDLPVESDHGGLTLSALGNSAKYSSTTRSTSSRPASSRRLFQSNASLPLSHSHAPPPSHLFHSREMPRPAVGDRPSTQERLHSLLEPYATPTGEGTERHGLTDIKPVYRVKFKPPVPRFTPGKESTTAQTTSGIETQGTHERSRHASLEHGSLYESLTSGLGPHEWENCPRRSPKRVRIHSAPCSPMPSSKSPKHSRSSTLPNQIPLETLDKFHLEHTDPNLTTSPTSAPDLRPPFVVRHVNPALLEKRNFCGESCSHPSAMKHHHPIQTSPILNERGSQTEDSVGHLGSQSGDPQPGQDGGTLSNATNQHLTGPSARSCTCASIQNKVSQRVSNLPPKSPLKSSLRSRATYHRAAGASMSAPTSPYKSQHRHHSLSSTSVPRHDGGSLSLKYSSDDALVAKYLVSRPGNTRTGVGSPSTMIQEKLARLRSECCKCLRTADSLGEDELSEDLERLKASLEAERQDTLNRSAKLLPDQSVTVKIGPRDYWSERMAEYTGKRHRVIFNETLEKIYNRLYTEATQSQ